MKSLSLPNGKVMFWARLDSIFLIQEIHRTQSTHALALHRFSVVILTAACGASKRLVGLRQSEDTKNSAAKPAVSADTISGSSIAPGGAGGRQS
jgi:hypothetical protein